MDDYSKINEIRNYCIDNNVALIINCNMNFNNNCISGNEDAKLNIYDSKIEGVKQNIKKDIKW